MTSNFFCPPVRLRPVRSPNDDTDPLALRDSSGQVDVSFSRAMVRAAANPNTVSVPALKRTCEKGILNSGRHPPACRVTATSHTASHPRSSLVSLNQQRSYFTPEALTPNSYVDRRSQKESR